MDQINAIRNSLLFDDQGFFILIGGLLVLLVAVGLRNKAKGGATGRYASAYACLTHLGNWARFPLALYALIAVCAGFILMVFAWVYHHEDGFSAMDPDRAVFTFGVALISALLFYWLLYEKVLIRSDKNRYALGTKWYGLPVVLSLPEKDRFEHLRIQGRAGTGKTTGFMFPQLIADAQGDCSAVFLDVKSPEGFESIAGAWTEQGKKVIVFDPYHKGCVGFEPLGDATAKADSKLADIVFGKFNTDATDTSKWFAAQERRMFILVCRLVRGYKDRRQRCLPMVYQLLARGLSSLKAAVTYCRDEEIQEKFEAYFGPYSRAQDTLNGILNQIDLFSEPKIAAAFSRPDLNLDLLFQEPTLLIIASPHSNSKVRTGAAMLLRALMQKVYGKPVRTALDGPPIFFYLDEFYALHIPDMADFANTSRSARVGLVTGLQSEEQLYRYARHEAASILANTKTNVYLQGCDLKTCERLSVQLGNCLVKDKRVSRSMKMGATISTGYVERPLETPDAIQNLPLDEALIFTGGMRGFKVKQISSYKNRRIRKKIGLPAKAYRPVDSPLIAPNYKDLDLPEIPLEEKSAAAKVSALPTGQDDGETLGFH
ncbi:MAG: type IV secretory system conjugative DNA transfer family protein [Nitrospiria bacterium]